MGEYVEGTVTTPAVPAMTLEELGRTDTNVEFSSSPVAATTTTPALIERTSSSITTATTGAAAVVTTRTLLSDALRAAMRHSTTSATISSSMDHHDETTPAFVQGLPNVNAATFARQKRRRKVQLLRQMKQKQQVIRDSRDTNTAVETLSFQVTRSFSKMESASHHSLMQSLIIDQTSNNISNATAEPIHEPSSQQPQHMLPSSTPSRTDDDDTDSDKLTLSFATIIPDANGLQEICHRLHERKECVAIPTECTYEMIQPFQYCTAPTLLTSKPLQKRTPYVYIPNVSIFDTCPFWKHVLPKKAYAIRKEPTSTTTTAVVSTFNESVQVLRRLSRKCWPGPILMYVQVPHVMDGLTVTVHSAAGATGHCYTNESNVQHYIAIRKPCHPLSRKVCTEYYKQQQLPSRHTTTTTSTTTTSAGTTTTTATISGSGSSSQHSSCSTTPSASPMFRSTPETPRLSSSRLSWQLPPSPFLLTPSRRVESNEVSLADTTLSSLQDGVTNRSCSSWQADNNTKPRPEGPESKSISTPESKSMQGPHLPFLLVGTPMTKGGNMNQKKKSSSSITCSIGDDYVRSADEAVAALLWRQNRHVERKSHNDVELEVSAVLHGEEQCEILSVPTCMYREPYPTSIWIDSTNRTVRIKNTMNHTDDDDDDDDENVTVDSDHVTLTPHAVQQRAMSPQSTMTRSNSFLSLQQEKPYRIDETCVVQALRAVMCQGRPASSSPATSPTAPLSSKERVLHAVLMKWKVVTENESCRHGTCLQGTSVDEDKRG